MFRAVQQSFGSTDFLMRFSNPVPSFWFVFDHISQRRFFFSPFATLWLRQFRFSRSSLPLFVFTTVAVYSIFNEKLECKNKSR